MQIKFVALKGVWKSKLINGFGNLLSWKFRQEGKGGGEGVSDDFIKKSRWERC